MDYNLVWGIYWTLAWFFAVFVTVQSIQEPTLSDISWASLTGLFWSVVVFGVGYFILSRFIG